MNRKKRYNGRLRECCQTFCHPNTISNMYDSSDAGTIGMDETVFQVNMAMINTNVFGCLIVLVKNINLFWSIDQRIADILGGIGKAPTSFPLV